MTTPPRWPSRARIAIALCGVAACAVWAFAPLSDTVASVPVTETVTPQQETILVSAFNAAPFSRPIWPPPPEPPKAPPPLPPPPAAPELRAQLIAITGDGDTRQAIVYDPAADTLRTVMVGDAIDHRTVTRITADSVDLTLPAPHNKTSTLTLKPADAPGREGPK